MIFKNDAPHSFSQIEQNGLVCNLSWSKSSVELLAPSLKEKNLLSASDRLTVYSYKHQKFPRFFQESDLAYCIDISQLRRDKNGTVLLFATKHWCQATHHL